jgi:hypothetical protein
VKAPGSRSVESLTDASLDDDASMPANASSPASISPVGPPPAITTACSVIATLRRALLVATSAADRPAARYSSADFALSGTFEFIFHFPG